SSSSCIATRVAELSLSPLSSSAEPLALPSFPTRRSSDLLLHFCLSPAMVETVVPADLVASASSKLDGVLKISCRIRVFCCMLSQDRKSTRLNSSHVKISYAVFCLKKKRVSADCRPEVPSP